MASDHNTSKTEDTSREGSPGILLDPAILAAEIRSPGSSRESSPALLPEQLASLQVREQSPDARASPRLPRKILKDLREEKDVADKSVNPPIKPWTFWFERAIPWSITDHDQRMKSIFTVRTIKEFWSVYNNIRQASKLRQKESYHLIREENGMPLWESPQNINGGIYVFKMRKEQTDDVWREILLAAIGEQFIECTDADDDVVGVSVKIREFDNMIQIWNKNASSPGHATIKDKLRQLLPDLNFTPLYSSNHEKMAKSQQQQQQHHQQHHPPFPPGPYGPRPPPPFVNQPMYGPRMSPYGRFPQMPYRGQFPPPPHPPPHHPPPHHPPPPQPHVYSHPRHPYLPSAPPN